jgi:competence protein CoiA
MPFRPRLFERYLHSMYFGRTYYWHRDLGAMVQPVHFGVASRRIAEHEFREDGETREGGGYWLPYKRIRTPMPATPVSIGEIFKHQDRKAHRPWNERRAVPAMRILIDKLPLWWDRSEQEILNRWYPDEEPSPS